MKTTGMNDRPVKGPVRPFIEIRLSEEHILRRVVILISSLVVAMVAFGFGIYAWLSADEGWQEITVVSTDGPTSGDAFTFYYDIGAGEIAATPEYKAVRALYSQACLDSWQLFSSETEVENVKNLWYLNQHINEEIMVDPALYSVLEQLTCSGMRYHFLAPMYEMYVSLNQCSEDYETADYDPYQNDELRIFYEETAEYVNSEEDISLELLGNDTVILYVSEEYQTFASQNGIDTYLDLGWMKNAFVADYLANVLSDEEYTRGTLISSDGFIRNLDDISGNEYSITLSHREGNTVNTQDQVYFSGRVSIAVLHDYPLGSTDSDNYYVFENGEIRSMYLDPADGLCKCSLPELVGSSTEKNCAELALMMASVFIADSFDETALKGMVDSGITFWYYVDGELYTVGGDL